MSGRSNAEGSATSVAPTGIQLSVASAPDTNQIVVLADGETFGPLAGARVCDVQAQLSTEEIEGALRQMAVVPIIEFRAAEAEERGEREAL